MTTSGLFLEDFNEGAVFETPGRTITETDIVMFAAFSGDYHAMHTDDEVARASPFGQRILHGTAGFAIAKGLFVRMGLNEKTGIAFLGMNWEMRLPIFIQDTVRMRMTVLSKRLTSKPGRGIVVFECELFNQKGGVCQRGQITMMYRTREGSGGDPSGGGGGDAL